MKKFKTTAAIAATAMMLSICMCGCGTDETSKDPATTSEQTQMTTENNNATGGNATNSNGVGNGIKDAADGVGEGVKDAAEGVGEGVKDAAEGVGNGVKDAVDGVEDAVDGIRVSDNNKEKGSACGIVFIPQTEPCFIFYRPVSPERMARSYSSSGHIVRTFSVHCFLIGNNASHKESAAPKAQTQAQR